MPKEAVFTMKLEPELRDAFMAAAAAADRPASQIVREMMRGYVAKRKEERDYDDFVRRKVEKSMQSVEAGRLLSSEQVEAEFAKKRAELLRRAAEKRD
ncbi:MAG: antitoxin of toxin-antitoxin stability system [Rhizobiales bacterium]|nr:antitoxin of toxin-antitoxin stability system [Hyphomicrobiales bacterium]OJU37750.1 MAG: antitoxin of toxin-antitoxin stability system [Rhizobiales bacterium 68-8]